MTKPAKESHTPDTDKNITESERLPQSPTALADPTTQQDDITTNVTSDDEPQSTKELPLWRRVYDVLSWTPPMARWDPENPPKFSMFLNYMFGFAGTFTVRIVESN